MLCEREGVTSEVMQADARAGPGCLGGRLHLCYCYSGWGRGEKGMRGERVGGGVGMVVMVVVVVVEVCISDNAMVGVPLRKDYSQVLAGTSGLYSGTLRDSVLLFSFSKTSSSPLMLSLLNMLPTCSRLPPLPPVGVWLHNVWTKKHRSVTVPP